jgi:hypothetical protein
LDVQITLQERCARIALTRAATDWPLPSLGRVLQALDDEGIDVVHLVYDPTALTVLVDEGEADHVARIFSRFYLPATAKSPSERLAS